MKITYEVSISLTGDETLKELSKIIKDLDDKHDCNAIIVSATDSTNPLSPRHLSTREVQLMNNQVIEKILEEVK